MEDSQLFELITRGTRESLVTALDVVSEMTEDQLRLRSADDHNTYLHVLVNTASKIYRRYGNITCTIPLVYRLAIGGVNVNAQNVHGNTCLHVACYKPHAESLCGHLIRVGVDPCIMNAKGCRIIHVYKNHKCTLVKGQASARSGIWNAVEKEDKLMIEKLLKSWCRVNVRKNKSLKAVGDETGNIEIVKLLERYWTVNEMAVTALSCDAKRLKEFLKGGKLSANIVDESSEIPKPLIVAVKELGHVANAVVRILRDAGCPDEEQYEAEVINTMQAYESSRFYHSINEGTLESMKEALRLLESSQVDPSAISHEDATNGWTFLHLIVAKFNKCEDEIIRRHLIRAIYKLALLGVDVNARDEHGDTALVKAAESMDQNLIAHILRIGADSSICTPQGKAVNIETYEDKGKIVFDKNYRVADLPGLWVAVENGDVGKTERWLKTWSRVNIRKNDRRLLDVARDLGRNEIVHLLEQYEHINEFVTATFACDLKRMMHVLALGQGQRKVNTIDDFFHVGYTWDRHAEYVPRPIIVSAMEVCTADVVDFMLRFGADLSKQHEEEAPCGPIAFWGFRDHIESDITHVIARHADVSLRDEMGTTMLHRAIVKKQPEGKAEIIQTLLDRCIDVSSRDRDGSTARDYLDIYYPESVDVYRQIIDDHVLNYVASDNVYTIETWMLQNYDYIDNIKGTKKHKTAKEIAHLKDLKEMSAFLDEIHEYRGQIDLLHECAKEGDLRTISKISGEKRLAWGRDKGGRTLLHKAVLYAHSDIVSFLIDQYPGLINTRDNLLRTPLHYCLTLKERRKVWGILQSGGADQNLIDVNNLSGYDYIRELENPTPTKYRQRGRRWQDYRPNDLIERERNMEYGAKATRFTIYRRLLTEIKKGTLANVRNITRDFTGSLAGDELDVPLLQMCLDYKRQEIAKYLLSNCGARPDLQFVIPQQNNPGHTISLRHYAKDKGLTELAKHIKTMLIEQEEKQKKLEQEQNVDNNQNQENENT